MNERMARVEKSTAITAFWVRFIGIVTLISLLAGFIVFISVNG